MDQVFFKTFLNDRPTLFPGIVSNDSQIFLSGIFQNNTGVDLNGNFLSLKKQNNYIIGMDRDGNQVFFVSSGEDILTNDENIIQNIVSDSQGVYTSFSLGVSGAYDFNNVSFTSYGESDIILANLSNMGEQKIFINGGSLYVDMALDIKIDSDTILMTGFLNLSEMESEFRDFQNVIFQTGFNVPFLVSLDKLGNQNFMRALNGNTGGNGFGIKCYSDGEYIYNFGLIRNIERDFDGELIDNLKDDFYNYYLVKFDRDGNQLFFKTMGGIDEIESLTSFNYIDIYLDDSGIYIAGYRGNMKGNTGVGELHDFDGNSVAVKGGTDIFITKLDMDGNQIFFKNAGHVYNDISTNLAVFNSDIYLSGVFINENTGSTGCDFEGNIINLNFKMNGFSSKFDSDGNQLFFNMSAFGILDSVVNNNGIYLTGFIGREIDPLDFQNNIIECNDETIIFVVKTDLDGNQLALSTTSNSVSNSSESNMATRILVENEKIFIAGIVIKNILDFRGGGVLFDDKRRAFVARLDDKSLNNNVDITNIVRPTGNRRNRVVYRSKMQYK